MPRIKRFDEIDSDSDVDFAEEAPVKRTMPTLSFKTGTEDSDSIAFESDREKSLHTEHITPPPAAVAKAPVPPAAPPAKVLPAAAPPPANLVKVMKAPPTATAGYAVKAVPQQPQPQPPVKSTAPPPSIAAAATAAVPSMPEKKKRATPTPPPESPQEAPVVPAFPTAAAEVERPAYATAQGEPSPTPRSAHAAESMPYRSTHSPGLYSSPRTAAGDAHPRHRDTDDSGHESDDFVQQVLPLQPRQQAQQPPNGTQRPPLTASAQLWASGSTELAEQSRLRSTPAETAADELLVRAQLRLEERRRLGASAPRSGSRQPSPWRGSAAAAASPAAPSAAYRDSALRQSAAAMSPLVSADPRVRRLQQENARLQDEVAFLGRENQKLRGVQGSAVASEVVRLQLTVDMLRKDLETKQVSFQRALDAAYGERKEAVRQAGEAAEQCESYQSSAEQYKQLYSEKQREMEKVKTQLQALLYDVNTMEQRNREVEAEYNERLAGEREKTERAMALAEDVKGQRDHLQFLNEQLRSEVTAAAEAKRQAVDQAAAASDAARRDRADCEQRVDQLSQDIAQLRKALAEKDRTLAAQQRESQQALVVLQDRMKEQAAEQQREAERSRRSLETLKDDHKRALQQERARRAEVEDRLRKAEEDSRASQTRHAASVSAESEGRVRKFREELQAERVAREAAEREAARLAAEVDELRDAAEYYQQESQRLSASFGQSEQLREKAERQCVSLSHTLEDMMAQEDTHARQIEQLQEALSASQWGSAGAAAARSADADGMVGDLQQLSDENDRLTGECTRLAEERDHLIEENGKIAEELLKWKHEMRQYVASHVRSPSPQTRRLSDGAF